MERSWCHEALPIRPSIPLSLSQYDDGWIQLVEDRVPCIERALGRYGIACSDVGRTRRYSFPPGRFALSQQVWLPPRVTVEGAASPNVVGDPRLRLDLSEHTLFVSTGREPDWPTCTSGAAHARTRTQPQWPSPSPQSSYGGELKCKRKGFLMNTETTVRNVHGQGVDEDGAGMGAGLNGGGFFELPGCATSYAAAGTCGKENGGKEPREGDRGPTFVTGEGKGVSNVLIENVRLNDLLDDEASLTAFWSAMPPDGSPHVNVTLRQVVTMRTKRDGINVHGRVIGWTGEDLHFENQGDDVYAVWGAGGGAGVAETGMGQEGIMCGLANAPATDVIFRRVFAGAGTSSWSSCAHVFGAGTVLYEDMLCCASPSPEWEHPALTIDSAFCASYPHANITVRGLRWAQGRRDLCAARSDRARVVDPGGGGSSIGWHSANLHLEEIGCP